jgi:2-iminobutanoate/2-iminopropanoate deaminase
MTKRVVLEPYDTYDLSTFVVHGDAVYIGHFGGMGDDNGRNLSTIEEQTLQTFKNLEVALGEINLSLKNLLKVTVILKNISDFHGMHQAWQQIFQSDYPVRTTLTSDFIDDDCLVQIDAVAGMVIISTKGV